MSDRSRRRKKLGLPIFPFPLLIRQECRVYEGNTSFFLFFDTPYFPHLENFLCMRFLERNEFFCVDFILFRCLSRLSKAEASPGENLFPSQTSANVLCERKAFSLPAFLFLACTTALLCSRLDLGSSSSSSSPS